MSPRCHGFHAVLGAAALLALAGRGSLTLAVPESRVPGVRRAQLFKALCAKSLFGCGCVACAEHAEALALLREPDSELRKRYEPSARNSVKDATNARGMYYSMVDYERAVSKRKRALFSRLLACLPSRDAVVVEVGIGSFPNSLYFSSRSAPTGIDFIGVDPNDFMEEYARKSAERAGLLEEKRGHSLRVVHGVAEALPLDSAVADAVISTLTLCSVQDPERAVMEMRRVLKPGGRLLFMEHVLSETNPIFAAAQRAATPDQIQREGCHFDRQTLQTIKGGQFQDVDGEYFELQNCGFLNPTVAGIATA
eukprot:TRINITY_DN62989_c0_g1_i1.p1 TRINITY_DN62989_c0_g1~~TRINITY_DN62989_c0_g1_i1.p1  ORF type:complete len:309 (-),score=49.48 TRINITY_DN62989_c0_g1_i1:65-991(-)